MEHYLNYYYCRRNFGGILDECGSRKIACKNNDEKKERKKEGK